MDQVVTEGLFLSQDAPKSTLVIRSDHSTPRGVLLGHTWAEEGLTGADILYDRPLGKQ